MSVMFSFRLPGPLGRVNVSNVLLPVWLFPGWLMSVMCPGARPWARSRGGEGVRINVDNPGLGENVAFLLVSAHFLPVLSSCSSLHGPCVEVLSGTEREKHEKQRE